MVRVDDKNEVEVRESDGKGGSMIMGVDKEVI
jgi:hypothetical protein